MKFAKLSFATFTLTGALVIHHWEWSPHRWPCGELPSSGLRVCQGETIRPEALHTLSSTVAINVLTPHIPGIYALASKARHNILYLSGE
jgi:hypothetical protein